jgi:hypothetical protein
VIVTFDRNMRDDDAEPTIAALRQIKGVLSVEPVISDVNLRMAEERVRQDLRAKLWEALA